MICARQQETTLREFSFQQYLKTPVASIICSRGIEWIGRRAFLQDSQLETMLSNFDQYIINQPLIFQ